MLSSLNYYPCPKATPIKIQSKVKESTCYADVASCPPCSQTSSQLLFPAEQQLLSHFYVEILLLPLIVGNTQVQLLEAGCHSHFSFKSGSFSFVFHLSDASHEIPLLLAVMHKGDYLTFFHVFPYFIFLPLLFSFGESSYY